MKSNALSRRRYFCSLGYELITIAIITFSISMVYVGILGKSPSGLWKYLMYLFVIVGIQFYYSYCWMKAGQTLAQRAWGLKISRIDGKQMGLLHWTIRFYWSLALNLTLIAPLIIIFQPARGLPQDRLMGTTIYVNN